MKMEQCVPKGRHIKFRRRGITQKKAYNIQNTVKVWKHEIIYQILTQQLINVGKMSKVAEIAYGWFELIIEPCDAQNAWYADIFDASLLSLLQLKRRSSECMLSQVRVTYALHIPVRKSAWMWLGDRGGRKNWLLQPSQGSIRELLLEKLIVIQVIKKCPALYGNWRLCFYCFPASDPVRNQPKTSSHPRPRLGSM
jgi:hypothetical protein